MNTASESSMTLNLGTMAAELNPDVTIMIIDDDDIDVRFITRLIQREGIENEIVVATDGQEALEKLRQHAPNSRSWPWILLLDINMPRLNGHEFLEILRDDPALRENIVFMRTTSDQQQDLQAAYAKMAAGYFVKSEIGHDGLVRILKNYLRSNHFQPELAVKLS